MVAAQVQTPLAEQPDRKGSSRIGYEAYKVTMANMHNYQFLLRDAVLLFDIGLYIPAARDNVMSIRKKRPYRISLGQFNQYQTRGCKSCLIN
jgi:hypothetical protein